jgi:hemoglobin
MMKDITARADIEKLMSTFYGTMLKDPILGTIFTDVAKINLEEHLPILCDFWESILFQNAKYRGNPMEIHIQLHEKVPLRQPHFKRWLDLFDHTVDQLYEGATSELAKQRAHSIALLMMTKIDHFEKKQY